MKLKRILATVSAVAIMAGSLGTMVCLQTTIMILTGHLLMLQEGICMLQKKVVRNKMTVPVI